jgi:ATP-dependent DNA helicase RecG
MQVAEISPDQAQRVLETSEGHFGDVKRIEVKPGKLTETVAAFANSSGGELYIGIGEPKLGAEREWSGFADVEAANGHLQAIEAMAPLAGHYLAEFLRCRELPGLVLHLTIPKSKSIMRASDGHVYIRRGAQKLRITDEEGLRRLRLDKGIDSFEDEAVNSALDSVTNSMAVISFMLDVVPSQEPAAWLAKQNLLRADKPTVAGVLLFADEPQAALPKRSSIKLYRYKTKDLEGARETLAFVPHTIEGCLYEQIKGAVQATKAMVEEIKRLGPSGLEAIVYPDETLHEIITNAVLHRDYSIPADIHVRIFDNRIEVESPGRLPGHITRQNILREQAARNPKIVRLINKFPDPPNQDVGEGLNTAFEAMKAMRLRPPEIIEAEHSVVVHIRHAPLASPHEAVLEYLDQHGEITNSMAREVTGVKADSSMRDVFYALQRSGVIEPVPGKTGRASAWRRAQAASAAVEETD